MDNINDIQTKQRYFYWDNIKGFLIFLVVFAHFLITLRNNGLVDCLFIAIYLFHMPAFAFVSGYFGKSEKSVTVRSILKLFIVFVLLNSIFMLFKIKAGEHVSPFVTYNSAWYLWALIVWRITTPYLAKIAFILPLSVIVSLGSIFVHEFNLTLGLVKIFAFFPFYIAGYLFTTDNFKSLRNLSTKTKTVYAVSYSVLAFVSGCITMRFFKITDFDIIPNVFSAPSIANVAVRFMIFVTSAFAISAILFLSAEKKLPFLTKFGKNSLFIYVVQRPVTLIFGGFIATLPESYYIPSAFLFSMLVCIIAGTDIISRIFDSFINKCSDIIFSENRYNFRSLLIQLITLSLICFSLFVYSINKMYNGEMRENGNKSPFTLYRVMEDENEYKDDFRLLFAGDLILLEDQVKRGFNGKNYDFSSYFEYTKKYISSADLSIGVLEGPFGGTEKKYSQSNYDDGKKLYLNFPDEFADAIKSAGFSLLTAANNHVLDTDLKGADRTIKILKQKGIDYTGVWSNAEDKKNYRVKFIEKDGIKFAVIAYTYGVNNYNTDELYESPISYVTAFLPDIKGPNFEKAKLAVKEDFKLAQSQKPDIIIVLPHWGTQFSDVPDEYQKVWERIFIENGADIILGCHTHSTQPALIRRIGDKNVYTLYSPGNFANIYRKHDGDASVLAEVYIDRKSKKIKGGSIIPMWTNSLVNGNYRAIPIFDFMSDKKLQNETTTFDFDRIKYVLYHITSTVLGIDANLGLYRPRYYFDEYGFKREKCKPLQLTEEMKNGIMYKLLTKHKNVAFLGDSVTEGSMNGGVGWYEPLQYLIKGKTYNISRGGFTSKQLLTSFLNDILDTGADLYVIAVGTNDVRYRNPDIGAMTPEEYIQTLSVLRNEILKVKPDAEFVFIAPWTSLENDTVSAIPFDLINMINGHFTMALKEWCNNGNGYFINPNPYINNVLDIYPTEKYMKDFIHPDSYAGVAMYSTAVMKY